MGKYGLNAMKSNLIRSNPADSKIFLNSFGVYSLKCSGLGPGTISFRMYFKFLTHAVSLSLLGVVKMRKPALL